MRLMTMVITIGFVAAFVGIWGFGALPQPERSAMTSAVASAAASEPGQLVPGDRFKPRPAPTVEPQKLEYSPPWVARTSPPSSSSYRTPSQYVPGGGSSENVRMCSNRPTQEARDACVIEYTYQDMRGAANVRAGRLPWNDR